jgi:hypothetical protein
MNLELTQKELDLLIEALDRKAEDFQNYDTPELLEHPLLVERVRAIDTISHKLGLSPRFAYHNLPTQEEKALPRLSTYTILTGDTYEIEAHTEEQALTRFYDYYNGKNKFRDTVCLEGEAQTVVIGHD